MNVYSNNVIDAIKTITQKEIEKIKFDKTDTATIIELINADTGEYRIEYKNNAISAYSADLTKVYKNGTKVYIKIINNDLSNKVIIEGTEVTESVTELEAEKITNSFTPVGKNFLKYYSKEIDELKLYKNNENISIIEPLGQIKNTGFILNSNKYEYIQISAEFETIFQEIQTKGNYGLKISFETVDGTDYSLTFDTSSFNGSLYNFIIPSLQSEIYPIKSNYITGIKEITFFAEGFSFGDEDFIRCSNLSIVFLEKNSEAGYCVRIEVPLGTEYNGNPLSLKAYLSYKGIDVKIDESAIGWQVQDLTAEDESGWKNIDSVDEIILQEDEIIKTFRANIKHEGVTYSNQINLTYKDKVPCNIKKVENDDGSIALFLSDNNKKGKWYYSSNDNIYNQLTEDENLTNSIIIPFDLLQEYVSKEIIFYCQVIGNNEYYIVSYPYRQIISNPANDINVVFSGIDVYKYDSNGTVPYETAEINQQLSFDAVWKNNQIKNYAVNWYLGNVILTQEKISLEDSMLKNVYVDKDNILRYNIRQRYEVQKTNNTLILKIKTADKEYEFKKSITFLKDGEQGTNGSSYVLVVRALGKKYINASIENDSIKFKNVVYQNGIQVNDATFFYDELNNVKISDNTITLSETNASLYYFRVIATINGLRLYSYFSVDVLQGNDNKDLSFSADYLPTYYQYNDKGLNPAYANKNVECLLGEYPLSSIEGNDKKSFYTISNCSIVPNNNISSLSPDKYISSVNLIFEGISGKIVHTIFASRTYSLDPDLNEWDGNSIKISNDEKIYATQLGAGTKNADNQFTGFLIGKNSNNDNQVGIYGYKDNVSTFLLDENGKARFGSENNGIIIDGETATIKGGNMIINLNNNESNSAIVFSNGNFSLSYDGTMNATGATISGKITANSGKIGGWTIENGNLVHLASGACLYGEDTENGGILDVSHIRLEKGNLCSLGQFRSSVGTDVVGLYSIQNSLVIESSQNVRLTGKNIYLDGNVYLDNNISLEDYIKNIVSSVIGG